MDSALAIAQTAIKCDLCYFIAFCSVGLTCWNGNSPAGCFNSSLSKSKVLELSGSCTYNNPEGGGGSQDNKRWRKNGRGSPLRTHLQLLLLLYFRCSNYYSTVVRLGMKYSVNIQCLAITRLGLLSDRFWKRPAQISLTRVLSTMFNSMSSLEVGLRTLMIHTLFCQNHWPAEFRSLLPVIWT